MVNGRSQEISTARSGEPSTPTAEATWTSASDGRSATTKSDASSVSGVRNPANARAASSGPVASLACWRVAPRPPCRRQMPDRRASTSTGCLHRDRPWRCPAAGPTSRARCDRQGATPRTRAHRAGSAPRARAPRCPQGRAAAPRPPTARSAERCPAGPSRGRDGHASRRWRAPARRAARATASRPSLAPAGPCSRDRRRR